MLWARSTGLLGCLEFFLGVGRWDWGPSAPRVEVISGFYCCGSGEGTLVNSEGGKLFSDSERLKNFNWNIRIDNCKNVDTDDPR